MEILLSPSTRKSIDSFISSPSHALGVFGDQGSGKYTVAEYLARNILQLGESSQITEIHIVRPNDKGSIPIEDIRGIAGFLKLKSVSKKTIARVVIIEDAHTLSTEAQNALLKTLEEPPRDTVIILTATSSSRLLATISSRIKAISLRPVDKLITNEFYQDRFASKDIEKAWLISDGKPGLMSALLHNEDHALLPYIESAKQILTGNKYDRLLMVDTLSKQDLFQLFTGLIIVSTAAFKQAVGKGNKAQIQRWHDIRDTAYQARKSLRSNPNSKLLLTDLMLSL